MKGELERETKWEVERDFAFPALDDLVPNGYIETKTVRLTSTYYDTADLDLLASNVTLRKRRGDDESGWQLKVPRTLGRFEQSTALSEEPPHELTAIVKGIGLGKELNPRTEIRTDRRRHRVFGPDRELVLEVDDDTVEASAVDGSGLVKAWREVEVELGRHTDRLPPALADTLSSAGAREAIYPSKLSRVLPARRRWLGTDTAERAVHDYLTTQIDAIFTGDIELRQGSDPIHDTRVATRRLRSTLRVFGKLLDRSAIEDVEAELKWYASVLGEVRDCEVQRRRLADRVAALPPELVLGPVAGRIDSTLLGTQVKNRAALDAAMDSTRYLRLLATLSEWKSAPPFTRHIRGRDLVDRADRAADKADRRLATALDDQRDESLHRARKAAKRARYAAELHRPVRKPRRAKASIAYYKRLQRVLGDHNDGVVSAEFLRRTGAVAGTTPGENGFTYGLLYSDSLHDAEAAKRSVSEVASRHP
ncbi:CYTH and CHAD domain-containing protein [Nocardia bovistercoris]|uniref:CYTH and CHAD domain-containing protein n=1 Tax=Nocardia bovistercoris TaxID=2785916 RepID=A0A931I7D1_9NOCA|nr:CYTH and CHAD domain-containing protein [Nocardia bovistercoris]MBH0775411.1 CYTH and CHAD domain-containing protein [Nocardia bovistercoris]